MSYNAYYKLATIIKRKTEKGINIIKICISNEALCTVGFLCILTVRPKFRSITTIEGNHNNFNEFSDSRYTQ